MKYMPLQELSVRSVYIRLHNVYEYYPPYYLMEYTIKNRHHSCIAYLAEGEYRYTLPGRTVIYHSGSLLYLPCGSSYRYQVLSENVAVYQIEFDLISTENGEMVFTGTEPLLISKKPDEEILMLIRSICSQALLPNSSAEMEALGNLYRLISSILQGRYERGDNAHEKMAMIVNYMNHNYMKNIQIQDLAGMCALSEAQFYRLFKSAAGLTPYQYLVQLRINTACRLLKSTEMPITGIASMLGFESVFSFSQTFKRAKAISPSQYRKNAGSRYIE